MADYRRRGVIAALESGGGGGGTAPDFSTATWQEIQAYIDEYGTNGFADQVGATRSITLTDNSVHTLRLENATGNLYELSDGSGYTGMIVEFLTFIKDSNGEANIQYSSSTGVGTGPLGDMNPLGTTVLPYVHSILPTDLKSLIPQVKVKSAEAYNVNTLVSSDMYLFIPARKELFGNTAYKAEPCEEEVLSQWKYYVDNNTNSARSRQGRSWWTRSARANYLANVVFYVQTNGDLNSYQTITNKISVYPAFCLAPQSTPTPTPTSFADDDWATIKYAVDNNLASAVYSVGDTKTITLSDSSTHTLRIANITGNLYEYADNAGTYTGFIVEFADCFIPSVWSSAQSNSGPLGQANPIGTTTLPNIFSSLPNDLQRVVANVKVVSAQDGSNLVYSEMPLFIPATKEIFGTQGMGIKFEADNLTTWAYYQTNNSNAYRIKDYNGSASTWWLRSKTEGTTNNINIVNGDGSNNGAGVWRERGVSPCFCI